jgi:hypothetical protein
MQKRHLTKPNTFSREETFNKLIIGGKFFNMRKKMYIKTKFIAVITLTGEKLKAMPLSLGARQYSLLSIGCTEHDCLGRKLQGIYKFKIR